MLLKLFQRIAKERILSKSFNETTINLILQPEKKKIEKENYRPPGNTNGKESACMWETWAKSLGLEHPLVEGMATHSRFFAWKIPIDRGGWWAAVHGVEKSWTRLSN